MDHLVAEARRAGTRQREWESLLLDRSNEVRSVIDVVLDILAQRMDVFAYFNNHFAGFAPGSIDEFVRLWNSP
jgi:hypothetical protein